MPQSLSFLLVHIVFSTKDRRPLLTESVRSGLHAYLATVTRDKECECFRAGGMADHVHLAVRLHPTKSVAKLIEELKVTSFEMDEGARRSNVRVATRLRRLFRQPGGS